jgi:predicted membrane protein
MLEEKIGAQAGSLNNRVLFFQGNVLVDAVFEKLSVMSAAELRELAGSLPQPTGSAGKLPTLRMYLPTRGYQKNSTKYILGPVALERTGSPLPGAQVDFKSGAEVVLARYAANAGDSTLMLIEYPTPQIAAEKLRQIDAAHQITAQQPGVASIVDVGPFFDKRTGPIVAIAAGPLSQSEARSILGSVSYEADVTWNENTFATKRDNLANLLFNVIVLCGVVVGLALVAGVGFGGVRILLKRVFPGRVFDRPEEMEIISLHLEDNAPGTTRRR